MRLSAGLDKIFRPKSIAIVGATARRGTIGREITHNLISYGFTGKVFPVNPAAEVIHSVKCHPSILDIADEIDLAIIMVRKDLVLSVVDECGHKGVGGVGNARGQRREGRGADGDGPGAGAAAEQRIRSAGRGAEPELADGDGLGVPGGVQGQLADHERVASSDELVGIGRLLAGPH